MPCTWTPEEIRAYNQDRLLKSKRAACEMLNIIRSNNLFEELSHTTQEWCIQHEKEDKEAIERQETFIRKEELKKKALSKLTEEEIIELGISTKG